MIFNEIINNFRKNKEEKERKKALKKADILNQTSGQTLYITIMFASFIAATIISAIINVIMFSQLSPMFYEKLLFIAISLTLEGTKVFTVIKSSILSSIGKKIEKLERAKNPAAKIKSNSSKKAAKRFLAIYLVFAFIAIFASLGLSLTITAGSGTEAGTELQKATQVISNANDKIIDLNKKITDLDFDSVKAAYTSADSRSSVYDEEIAKLNKQYKDSGYKDMTLSSSIAEKKALQKALKVADKKLAYESALQKKEQFEKEIEDNKTLISNSKTESIDLSAQETKEKGTSNMFKLMADLLKFLNENLLKFIVLMTISVLIELTIYTAAPEININRKILYYFRKYIPDSIDVDELLDEIDNDLKRFLEDKKTEKVISLIEETKSETIKETPIEKIEPVKEIEVEKTIEKISEPKVVSDVTSEVKIEEKISEESKIDNNSTLENKEQEEQKEEEKKEEIKEEVKEEVSNSDNSDNSDLKRKPKAEKPVRLGGKKESSKETIFEKEVILSTDKGKTRGSESVVKLLQSSPKSEENKVLPPKKELPIRRIIDHSDQPSNIEKKEEVVNEAQKLVPQVSRVSADVINYRFGKASEAVKNTLINYIRDMMEGLDDTKSYPALIKDPVESANKLGIHERVRDVLLKRLKDMKYNDIPLIKEMQDNTYVTNFNPLFLEEYLTQIIAKKD